MTFKNIFGTAVLVILLAACAAKPKRGEVIEKEASYLQAPPKKFSNYGKFELKPMKMAKEIADHNNKRSYATKIENGVNEKLNKIFETWTASGKPKLIIQPEMLELRIVGGASRFFLGGMAGGSHAKMRINIIDAKTKKLIASPVIGQQSSGHAGGWSVGATDQNIVGYVVDISERYFLKNYK